MHLLFSDYSLIKTRDVINPEANEDVRKVCAMSVNQQAVV